MLDWVELIVAVLLIESFFEPIADIVRAFRCTTQVINHCCCSENCGCRDED